MANTSSDVFHIYTSSRHRAAMSCVSGHTSPTVVQYRAVSLSELFHGRQLPAFICVLWSIVTSTTAPAHSHSPQLWKSSIKWPLVCVYIVLCPLLLCAIGGAGEKLLMPGTGFLTVGAASTLAFCQVLREEYPEVPCKLNQVRV